MRNNLFPIRFLFLFLLLLPTSFLNAQSLPVPTNIEAAYRKGTRNSDGKPGARYWQNRADYNIDVRFDPSTRMVTGAVSVRYFNQSPDTLKQIWIKLYPNLYKAGVPHLSKINPADLSKGLEFDSVTIGATSVPISKLNIDGTNLILNRLTIMPSSQAELTFRYHYVLNKGSHVRTGEVEQGAYFIAYFFPRIAVYDDIDGWNKFPYNGIQEFYNDFCNFRVNVTVPKAFCVWGTGNLENAQSLLAPNVYEKLMRAERSDQMIDVIDSNDLKNGATQGSEWNVWRFDAQNVTDFAFALSDHYLWQSSSVEVDHTTKRRTRADAVFNPSHKDYYWVAPDARRTVEEMSFYFPKWPFPYPHITVFDGLDQMEYPMMVNDNPVETRFESVTLTDHEIFHTMFPFYMGINETKYAWMDEGWATIGEWLVSPRIDTTIVDDYGVVATERQLGSETDLPVMALSTEQSAAYFTNSYPEPAMGYLYVKDMLGDSLFFKALHYYIGTWSGRHPGPFDFFNCMNKGSGKNLNWFWNQWFFGKGYANLAITEVVPKLNAWRITITAKGTRPVPIDLVLEYVDKTEVRIHRTIAVWEQGSKSVTLTVPGNRKLARVRLGSTWIPDSDHSDNVYVLQ